MRCARAFETVGVDQRRVTDGEIGLAFAGHGHALHQQSAVLVVEASVLDDAFPAAVIANRVVLHLGFDREQDHDAERHAGRRLPVRVEADIGDLVASNIGQPADAEQMNARLGEFIGRGADPVDAVVVDADAAPAGEAENAGLLIAGDGIAGDTKIAFQRCEQPGLAGREPVFRNDVAGP